MKRVTQVDPLKGMNPDQSGPKEKIQNGDPKSGANRDQRSGAAEAGGPGGTLQQKPTGGGNEVPPHDSPTETTGAPMAEGATTQAGTSPLYDGEPLKDAIEGDGTVADEQTPKTGGNPEDEATAEQKAHSEQVKNLGKTEAEAKKGK